jgi:hypothetical protein
MGRIDQVYLMVGGLWMERLHHDWLLLVALTAATLAIYIIASRRDRARRQ